MRAAVLEAQAPIASEPLRVREVPEPAPGPGEVLVRVRACGVCHTDLHIVEGDLPARSLPLIPGHQIVGEVAAHGQGAAAAGASPVGARVGVPWLSSTCGRCRFCASGRENLCDEARFTGYDRDGGFAELAAVPAGAAYPLPAGIDACAAAPLLCGGVIGYRALRLSGARPGDVLGLYGFGASAHLVLQLARAAGIEVFVFSRAAKHQDVARGLGAAWVGRAEDEPPALLSAAIIFAPAGELVLAALGRLEKGGTCALAGIHMSAIPALDYDRLLYGERQLRSVANSTRADVRELLAAAGRLQLHTEIEVFPLREANRALTLVKRSQLKASGVLRIED
jgi:propanol-preferring alcohol dehydrogenase